MNDSHNAVATVEAIKSLREWQSYNKLAAIYTDLGRPSLAASARAAGELYRQRALTLFHKAARSADDLSASSGAATAGTTPNELELKFYPTITNESEVQ